MLTILVQLPPLSLPQALRKKQSLYDPKDHLEGLLAMAFITSRSISQGYVTPNDTSTILILLYSSGETCIGSHPNNLKQQFMRVSQNYGSQGHLGAASSLNNTTAPSFVFQDIKIVV